MFVGARPTSIHSTRKEESPRKKKLQQRILHLKARVKTLDERNRRLRRKIKNLSTKKEVEKEKLQDHEILRQLGSKFFSPNFVQLLCAQIDAQVKSKRGRRYTSEFALRLYFLSPRCYKELKKEIALPSIRSLQTFTQTWQIKPGINDKIFDVLSIKLNTLPLMERHCILCIDEMSLKTHLFYNVSRDEIIGFEDTGNEKLPLPAKSALVIMARSIAGNWKLPVCFCLVETACKSDILKPILFDIIRKLRNCNTVHALITDTGSNFLQLSRELGISVQNPIFLVDEQEVLYMFGTPHLIKRTRDNLLKYDVEFGNNKIASWSHIVEFYNKDSKQWIKLAPKLSKDHIEPISFQKMKVKYAVQILSNRVAARMCTQMSFDFLPSAAVGTIHRFY